MAPVPTPAPVPAPDPAFERTSPPAPQVPVRNPREEQRAPTREQQLERERIVAADQYAQIADGELERTSVRRRPKPDDEPPERPPRASRA